MAWNDPPSFDYQQLSSSGKKFKHRYVMNTKLGQPQEQYQQLNNNHQQIFHQQQPQPQQFFVSGQAPDQPLHMPPLQQPQQIYQTQNITNQQQAEHYQQQTLPPPPPPPNNSWNPQQ